MIDLGHILITHNSTEREQYIESGPGVCASSSPVHLPGQRYENRNGLFLRLFFREIARNESLYVLRLFG